MSFEPRDYLRHILAETDFLISESKNFDLSSFKSNETVRRAFIRSLEVIGEAAKNIPEDFRREEPQIDWRGMAGMRDRLIHGYFGVDYDLIWAVVTEASPNSAASSSLFSRPNGWVKLARMTRGRALAAWAAQLTLEASYRPRVQICSRTPL